MNYDEKVLSDSQLREIFALASTDKLADVDMIIFTLPEDYAYRKEALLIKDAYENIHNMKKAKNQKKPINENSVERGLQGLKNIIPFLNDNEKPTALIQHAEHIRDFTTGRDNEAVKDYEDIIELSTPDNCGALIQSIEGVKKLDLSHLQKLSFVLKAVNHINAKKQVDIQNNNPNINTPRYKNEQNDFAQSYLLAFRHIERNKNDDKGQSLSQEQTKDLLVSYGQALNQSTTQNVSDTTSPEAISLLTECVKYVNDINMDTHMKYRFVVKATNIVKKTDNLGVLFPERKNKNFSKDNLDDFTKASRKTLDQIAITDIPKILKYAQDINTPTEQKVEAYNYIRSMANLTTTQKSILENNLLALRGLRGVYTSTQNKEDWQKNEVTLKKYERAYDEYKATGPAIRQNRINFKKAEREWLLR